MTDPVFYRTTAKGRDEAAAQPGVLKPGLKGLLAAVGEQSTAAALKAGFPRVTGEDLSRALDQLAQGGYIETVTEVPERKPHDNLLDFLNERPKEPTLQQRRDAEGTLSGARRLKAGYQITILNRPGHPLPSRSGGKHVVLIIDAQEAEALAAARSLMQGGFDVRGAANKPEIVAALRKAPLPDLIVMDVELPDAVGLDVLGKLHEHPEFKDTPIIVVTARAERDDIVAALAYGATGYLNKPVSPTSLLQYVRDSLGLP